MEKLELRNIKDLYKLRIRQLSGYIKGLAVITIGMLILNFWEIVLMMKNTSNHCYAVEFPKGVFVFVALILMIVFSYNTNIFKKSTGMYPQNRVTRYVASWLSDITVLGIFSLLEVVCVLIIKFVIFIICATTDFSVFTKINAKFILGITVYILAGFLFLTAVIKLTATIARKSILVLLAIVMGILFLIRNGVIVLSDSDAQFNVVGKDILEILITCVIFFVIGFLLEKYIKDSKFTINYGNILMGIVIAMMIMLLAVTPLFYGLSGTEEMEDYVKGNKEKAEKVEYSINIPAGMKVVEEGYGHSDMDAIGVENVEIRQGDKAKVVVRKYIPTTKSSLIDDIFADSDINVSVENNKFVITNKSLNKKYIALNVYGFQNADIQRFMGNKVKDSDDDLDDFKEMISRYTTSYRVVIYVPKANTSENINSEFIKIK